MKRPEATPVAERPPIRRERQSDGAMEAEKMAFMFGLGYLSGEAFQKLADLIKFVRGEVRK